MPILVPDNTEQLLGGGTAYCETLDLGICFAAGTPVLLADGTTKPIETLQPGDRVLSAPENDVEGAVAAKTVERVFHNPPSELIRLTIGGTELRSTPPHLFYVRDKGWTAAEDLEVGDQLRTPDARWVTLDAKEAQPDPEPVFNFRVADYHTYFVGDPASGEAVLVHNEYDQDADTVERLEHALEMAILAKAAYTANPGDRLPLEGWMVVASFDDRASGFRAVTFKNLKTGKIVLAFAGTDPKDFKGDWPTNGMQGFGLKTAQYEYAIALAKGLAGSKDFEIVGHSLGGGLASAAAIVTNTPATVFNLSGVNAATVARHGKDLSTAANSINVYRVRAEALTTLQNSPTRLGVMMPDTVGQVYPILMPELTDPVTLHNMDTVVKSLELEIRNAKQPPFLDSLKATLRDAVREGLDYRNWIGL